MNYAVIMAGGVGSRLWPLSRKAKPKQVLDIFGNESLLRKSFARLLPSFEPDNIFVQTNIQHAEAVRRCLPDLPDENIISEPSMRNTSGAIALAATVLTARDKQATMLVVTADHVIEPVSEFSSTVDTALRYVNANPDTLVTFGIKPTFAATQYGYIHLAKPIFFEDNAEMIYKVGSFREKPDLETAEKYISASNYYWNSGMFVWKCEKILDEIRVNIPGSAEPISKISEAIGSNSLEKVLAEEFAKIPKISIDYAVMEKSSEVYALKMNCKWLDMGSYQALTDLLKKDNNGNSISCKNLKLLNCSDNIIVSTSIDNHLIAAIGLEDMVIAHTQDATFICPKEQIERIKDLINEIEKDGNQKYL